MQFLRRHAQDTNSHNPIFVLSIAPDVTTISCSNSPTTPGYHIPSQLSGHRVALQLLGATQITIKRQPPTGYNITSRGEVIGLMAVLRRDKTEVVTGVPVDGVSKIKSKKGEMKDAATDRVLARRFAYKAPDGGQIPAIEVFVNGSAIRDLVVAVWVAELWLELREERLPTQLTKYSANKLPTREFQMRLIISAREAQKVEVDGMIEAGQTGRTMASCS
ncbi:hypothetical protein BZA77DRAFT_295131 [Pyronema omphalodes]|nr:hypothetical protein BZA77DRAFT_295131 [Pyronema omphalodes]